MRPSFHPRLINNPFNDPGLFIPFTFQNRALIFDLGDISSLPARDILKISHAFVSHAHMDHFIGFDHLLRLMLGRDKILALFGPPDFLKNIEAKLSGYTWNLAEKYNYPLRLQATEIHEDFTLSRDYRCQDRFAPVQAPVRQPFDGIVHREPAFKVSAAILDHRIPCLGLSVKERFHVNILKEGLIRMGLEPGAWLTDFKQALYRRTDPAVEFEVALPDRRGKKVFVLGKLADQIARITPGQKIAYITDVVYSDANRKKITDLARDSDHLFIEAVFLDRDHDLGQKKYHLTARQAGELAAEAGARQFSIFHFSPRYTDRENLLHEEAREAYNITKIQRTA